MMQPLILLCVITGATALASPLYSSPDHPDWIAFKQNHGKAYSSLAEEHYRFELFMKNKEMIEKHNKEYTQGKHSFNIGINNLADLTPAELIQLQGYLAPSPSEMALVRAQQGSPHNSFETPESMDWREEGAIAPVQSQGQCGSCYAYAAVAALEAYEKVKTGKLVKLSEQNIIDCDNETHGCRGGLPSACYTYIKENDGIDTEKYYSNTGKQGTCHYSVEGRGATDNGFNTVPEGDENAMKDVVGNHGPVAVAVDTSDHGFLYYKSGVYTSTQCKNGDHDLTHSMAVVGYGTENGHDYWLVRNSWGSRWGDNGYIKMARNYGNMCGIATVAVWPKV